MGVSAKDKLRSGTREWVFQRVANFLICLWAITFITTVLLQAPTDMESWRALFVPMWFKLFSTLVLLFAGLNSMLAGWQIGTDYIKVPVINRPYMWLVKLISIAYVVIGLYILWGLS